MAWVKVPKEHHPIFLDALPTGDVTVSTMPMFGGIAVTVNGNIAAGLFGRSVMLRLGDDEANEVLAMEGGTYFDPMGRGMQQPGKVMLPEAMMQDPAALRLWIGKAIDLARTLPPKGAKGAKGVKGAAKSKAAPATKALAKKAKRPATKAPARKAPAKRAPAKKAPAKKARAKKAPAKKPKRPSAKRR